jgi:DNA-directed RNA polymerase subunit M/transcription elongation factor TFIIS
MIIFSEITCSADTTDVVATGFVGGEPICYNDLSGWTVFEDFLSECRGYSNITVEVKTYGYGEGPEKWDAEPEEVAYMVQRLEANPSFLESRCEQTRYPYKVSIQWEPLGPSAPSETMKKASVSVSEAVTPSYSVGKTELNACPRCRNINRSLNQGQFPKYDDMQNTLTKFFLCSRCSTEYYEIFKLEYAGCKDMIDTKTEDGYDMVELDAEGNRIR